MTQPNSQEENKGGDEAPEVVQTDAFGEPVKVTDAQVVTPPATDDKGEDDKGADEKKADPVELAKQVGTLEAELKSSKELHEKKDSDIRAMADKIKRFENANGGAPEGGQKQEGDVLFKEIKTSKDLTQDEKDEMTDAEIKALDEMATLKSTINTLHQQLQTANVGKDDGVVDVNKTVKDQALALSNTDVDVANKIIEAFNGAKFNTKEMTAEEIQKAVEMVAGTVTGYKPKTEAPIIPGGFKKPAGGGKGTDPHGVDHIVKEVAKSTTSNAYSL